MKRRKYLEAAFGPIRESQLTLAPPFWFAQMDLLGPVKVYAPGREKNTRSGLAALDAKNWIMVIVCPTTRLINMQVLERVLADAIISGITRLSCEIGVPKKLFVDQAKAIECGLENVEFDLRGLQHILERQHGIDFEVCPVAGRNQHGHVERVIRSVQESFNDCGLLTKRYTATTLQTLAELGKKFEHFKKAENSLLDIDDITAQVMDPRPEGRRFGPKPEHCVSKRAQQRECCCQEYCNLTSHYHGNRKMELFEKQAAEVYDRKVTESEVHTDIGDEILLGVDAVLKLKTL